MKAWFFGLQQRERWIVAIGAAAAVVIIVWGFGMQLRSELASLRASVDTKQRLLIDVARIEGELPATVVNDRQGRDQTLAVIVDNTARSHGLNPTRVRANGPSGVDVSIQGGSFDALVAWLVALHGTYGVDVDTAQFTSAREPGLVNGQLSLRRL
jgi:type II secretory pathway component PulM